MPYYFTYVETPIGLLQLKSDNHGLISILFVEEKEDEVLESPLTQLAGKQIGEYFEGKRKTFQLPLILDGTALQQQVWEIVKTISFGKSLTYSALARQLKQSGNPSAVGQAGGKNRFAIVIPCHRLIGQQGKLASYAWGQWRKEWLLKHEGILKHSALLD